MLPATPAVPRATYRLQLSHAFTFVQAAAQAPYLGSLGVSHVYLSPILEARRHSTHGYDVVDHTRLNPELGTREEFEAMAAEFRRHGMGIILDIVPNHMGVGGDQNALWLDVLRWGKRSRYADWFDINWAPLEASLHGKVLVPFLASPFGEALEAGRLELRQDAATQSYDIWAEDVHRLPICPDTYHLIGDPGRVGWLNSIDGQSSLRELIEAQHWRPARYSVAADDINYRRFFIVSDLAGIRVERDEVFEHAHRLTFELVEAGLVDGLRVDHIDGLYHPKAYCLRLREACPQIGYLVVEKILAGHEKLREAWGVDGTTGYEFATAVTRLLTDRTAEDKLTALYQSFTGHTEAVVEVERQAKLGIIDFEMTAELDALAARLRTLATASPGTADITRNALRSALREVAASMPVYRTYVDDGPLDERDARNLAVAVAAARRSAPMLHPTVFDFLSAAMSGQLKGSTDIARRIQQYTGPVMAKGLEDTSLYRYNRLIALSDVGEKPDRFGGSIAAFHDWARARAEDAAHGLLTSSSHDSKRGEDARARIAAISGYADEWARAVAHWDELLQAAGAPRIEANDRYYFYQLMLGAWPADFEITAGVPAEALSRFRERLEAAMLKSVREARRKTNWSVPKSEYEEQVSAFVGVAISDAAYLESFRRFERLVGTAGAQNGLIETVLKLTIPGVPDIYQGAEFWEQSMVDPDNRREVDFVARAGGLDAGRSASLAILRQDWRNGRIKQRLIADLLAFRKADPDLFAYGSYEPLAVGDDVRICAFARHLGGNSLVVAVRLGPWVSVNWGQERLPLPRPQTRWKSIVGPADATLPIQDLFADLPLVVLSGER